MHQAFNVDDWVQQNIKKIPHQLRGGVFRLFEKKHSKTNLAQAQNANAWLLGVAESLKKKKFTHCESDFDICQLADQKAKEAMGDCSDLFMYSIEQIRARLEAFCRMSGVEPPSEKIEIRPAIARMTCRLWWRRQLRKVQIRSIEAEFVRLGLVSKRTEVYCSNFAFKVRIEQNRRNLKSLSEIVAKNEQTGQEFELSELSSKGVSNPAIRQAELMVRIRGFDDFAKQAGHAGVFVTLTCPSKYHANKTVRKDGKQITNPKYGGYTPREAQNYLTKVWARIRAKLHRDDIRVYGFRVAEPHGDGCPHWHMVLFSEHQNIDSIKQVFRKYALEEDGDEAGAHEKRVDFMLVDGRGATGYLAKYISKNISKGMHQVDFDFESGLTGATSAERVQAWAACWGIRQFQQIGGAPVGIWRELRRVEQENITENDGVLLSAWASATAGNWARFTEIMGGGYVKRSKINVSLAKTCEGQKWDYFAKQTYDAPMSRYGDCLRNYVLGVVDVVTGAVVESRHYKWVIKAASSVKRFLKVSPALPQSLGFLGSGGVFGDQFSGEGRG